MKIQNLFLYCLYNIHLNKIIDMFNDCSEAEYLAELWEDNCICEDEYEYNYTFNKQRPKPIGVYRKKKLSESIEKLKSININKKKYSHCYCPMCKREFIKKSYQQIFCSNKCRIKYHNKRKVYVY